MTAANDDHGFHRWVDPAEKGGITSERRIEATEAERAALADWLDIPGVSRLTASLKLVREDRDVTRVSGSYAADLQLVCGVSLETFAAPLKGDVEAVYRRAASGTAPHRREKAEIDEIEIDLDEDEPGEWTAQGIDLGALLAAELSLAVPDFPRKPGAEVELPDDLAAAAEKENPFAALARLKDKGANDA